MAVSDYKPAPVAGKVSSDESELVVQCGRTPKVIRSVRDFGILGLPGRLQAPLPCYHARTDSPGRGLGPNQARV